jgi:hypothetical protein
MNKLTSVAICTCLVIFFGAGMVLQAQNAPQLTIPNFLPLFLYTKTCTNTQICACNSPTDVVISGGAKCSQDQIPLPWIFLTNSGPTCVIPVESGGYIGCLGPSPHVSNAWYAECGECTFSPGNGPSCTTNLDAASITITCMRQSIILQP